MVILKLRIQSTGYALIVTDSDAPNRWGVSVCTGARIRQIQIVSFKA